MKRTKTLSVIAVLLLIMTVICGCGNDRHGARTESNDEYIRMMKAYMEDKYSASFEVVESSLPRSGFSGMELNILVLRDSSGHLTNVRAKYGTPYQFYDDYDNVCAAAEIHSELEVSGEHIAAWKLYANIREFSPESIDISPENISSVTVLAKVTEPPSLNNLRSLYEIYGQICDMGYENVYFLTAFVEESSDFDAAVENYTVYGKSKWSDYNGTFYGYLRVVDVGLSFDEFRYRIEQ